MLEKRLGSQHENRAACRFIESHEQRGHGELDGFPQANLIGEDQTRATKPVTFQSQPGEILLVRPETLFATINRRFNRSSSGSAA